MKKNIIYLLICINLMLYLLSCDGNVEYDYGVKDSKKKSQILSSNKVTYSNNILTGYYYKTSHDTCYISRSNEKYYSIVDGFYIDPNYLYVKIFKENFPLDKTGCLVFKVESGKKIDPYTFKYMDSEIAIFKIKKSEGQFTLYYKDKKYNIEVDENYSRVYLKYDQINEKILCYFTSEIIKHR